MCVSGVASHVKLLLKLIEDHKDATNNNKNDGRKMLRVATMMTILDNVRSRIQKCQFKNKKSEAELRRCSSNSDIMSRQAPRGGGGGENQQHQNPIADEKERLKKALNASLAARKSLEIMCTGLGKEKEIMSIELAKRIHLMNEMEELISDLKVQNQTLRDKVRECASEHREKKGTSMGETHGNVALQERNRALSEHLQRALDGYRSMKKKAKELHEENILIRGTMEEIGEGVRTSLERLHRFKESLTTGSDPPPTTNIQEEIARLEQVFQCFEGKLLKQNIKGNGECVKPKGEISACTPSIFA